MKTSKRMKKGKSKRKNRKSSPNNISQLTDAKILILTTKLSIKNNHQPTKQINKETRSKDKAKEIKVQANLFII
jgi:hypothetical protein